MVCRSVSWVLEERNISSSKPRTEYIFLNPPGSQSQRTLVSSDRRDRPRRTTLMRTPEDHHDALTSMCIVLPIQSSRSRGRQHITTILPLRTAHSVRSSSPAATQIRFASGSGPRHSPRVVTTVIPHTAPHTITHTTTYTRAVRGTSSATRSASFGFTTLT
jgi:hypothetical protein